jgi:hypothetical protein
MDVAVVGKTIFRSHTLRLTLCRGLSFLWVAIPMVFGIGIVVIVVVVFVVVIVVIVCLFVCFEQHLSPSGARAFGMRLTLAL